jgi:D-alanyl-D-alanine carboxypeptidase
VDRKHHRADQEWASATKVKRFYRKDLRMTHKIWILVMGIFIGLIVVAAGIYFFTRRITSFIPPADRQLGGWGTMDRETAQKLQTVLDEEVNLQKVPGFQAFVRTPDGKTWSGTSGTTDLKRHNFMQRDNVIRIGSTTKTFTAVLVLKLVEQGRLSLDDPLSKWFPTIPDAEAITIRNLLNHSSGIAEIIPKGLMKSILPSTYWTRDELVKLIARDPLLFTPGSRFEYSNSNYILLGFIVEDLTGKTVLQLLHEQILDPLNLQYTYFIPYEPAPARLLTGFDRDLAKIPGMLTISPNNTSWATLAYASGAIASNADDLGVFFDNLFEGKLLSPATLEEMETFIPASNPGLDAQIGSGLGLMCFEVAGQELIGHVGEFMGSSSIAMYAPDKGYTIVVTSNLSNPDLTAVLASLREIINH